MSLSPWPAAFLGALLLLLSPTALLPPTAWQQPAAAQALDCIGARQMDPWPPAADVAAACEGLLDQIAEAQAVPSQIMREALKTSSWTQRRLGNQNRAIFDATQAIALAGDDAEAFYYRSAAFDKLRHYPQAIRDIRQAIALQPDYARAHALRGQILLHMTQYPAALDAFNRALSLNPALAAPQYNQARIYAINGQYQRAIDGFNQVLSLRPDHIWALRERAAAEIMLDRDTAAGETLQVALRLRPKFIDAYLLQANIAIRNGNLNQAQSNIAQALAIDPDHLEAGLAQARLYYYRQQYSAALDVFQMRVAADNRPQTNLWRALAQHAMNQNRIVSEDENKDSATWAAPFYTYFEQKSDFATLQQQIQAEGVNAGEALCYANLYAGLFQRLVDNQQQAQRKLQAAKEHCAKTSIEYEAASQY